MNSANNQHLILASLSPRRAELLKLLGLQFEVIASNIDESAYKISSPAELAIKLAYEKAKATADLILNNSSKKMPALILAADTIVVLNESILGKPKSEADAHRMLSILSGKQHYVYTGVTLLRLPDLKEESSCEISKVYFRSIDEREIKSYIASSEPMDKAGAYALQGAGGAFVQKIDGCFTNIIGLPLPLVIQLLRKFDFSVLGV